MISYAQNFEDVMLRRVFRDRKHGFYIDIGAMDPVEDSVTKFFYDEGWSGINVEPNDYFYRKLVAERPRDINLRFAVGEREETRCFHVFETFGNSTFDEASRNSFAREGYESEQKIVRVTTLAAICREYVKQEIDFLKIDCEGWEKNVLEGADWVKYRPTVLVIEATQPGSTVAAWQEWERIVINEGRYEMVFFDGLNRFYLRREYSDLKSHFAAPPNVFDAFTTRRASVAEHANAAYQQERTSLLERLKQLDEVVHNLDAKSNEQAGALLSLQEQLAKNQEEKKLLEERTGAQGEELCRLADQRDVLELRLQDLIRKAEQDMRVSAHALKRSEEAVEVLKRDLVKAHLWIGQLSQDLASHVIAESSRA